MKCSLGISNLFEDLWSFPLYCSPVFICIVHWGRLPYLSLLFFGILQSDGYIFAFLLSLLFIFLSQLFIGPPQKTICLFAFFLRMVLITDSCKISQTFIHSSIIRDLIFVIPEWPSGFLHFFFNLSLNFTIRSSWSEPQSDPSLLFADCVELLHLWLQKYN